MDGMLPIRRELDETLSLSDQRSLEITKKIGAILRDGGSSEDALEKSMKWRELCRLDTTCRKRILFKIDLYLALLEMEQMPQPLNSCNKIRKA